MPGHLPEAIAEYQEALRMNPTDLNTHNRLGLALAQQGNLDGALAQFKENLQIAPESAQGHNNFGNALAKSGRLVEAIDQYELALQLTPDFTAARNNLELVRHAMTQQANDRFKAGLAPFVGPLVWVIF
jgi:tetratricopeptide (TPR) repeat protein